MKKAKGFDSLTKKVLQTPSSLADFQNTVNLLSVSEITPDPNQPRKYFEPESLNELTESVRKQGILQPVIVRKDENSRIWLVAGERRFRAAVEAGLDKIPVIFTKGNPAEISLIENLQRENLNPVEEAEALNKIADEYGYTHEQLASIIGKARSTITEILSLNRLPAEIRDECRRADNYPRRLLAEIAKQDSPEEMIKLFRQIKEQNLKSSQVRDVTRKPKSVVQTTLSRAENLFKSLVKLNIREISNDDRLLLIQKLDELKKQIEDTVK